METFAHSLFFRRFVVIFVPGAILVTSCFLKQELDENAVSNLRPKQNSSTAGAGGNTTGAGTSTGGGMVGTDPCEAVRSQARTILETSCASCHQVPNVMANFDFILDLELLKTRTTSSTNQRFVIPGDPDNSRLYQRIAGGEMPPSSARVPRPTANDVAMIREWITRCLDGSSGWPTPDGGFGGGRDAAVEVGPPPGCGDPGQQCCLANVCNNDGCCVFGQCRAQGQTCTTPPPDLGLSGTCSKGSCETMSAMACGNVDQPCCEASSCTASRASCLANATTCSACGGAAQPCCKIGSAQECIAGFTCVGGGVNRTGNCQLCGADGQPCCGTGLASQRTCNPGLKCAPVLGKGDLCGP
jgi:hypothetical protein